MNHIYMYVHICVCAYMCMHGYTHRYILIHIYIISFFSFVFFFSFWLHWVFIAERGLSLVTASGGLLFVVVRGLLIAVASLVVEHGL